MEGMVKGVMGWVAVDWAVTVTEGAGSVVVGWVVTVREVVDLVEAG